jgi:hypothetical protein
MKTSIFQNDVFIREAVIEPIASVSKHYSLKFNSILRNAKDPNAANCNFESILDDAGLVALRDLIEATLKG